VERKQSRGLSLAAVAAIFVDAAAAAVVAAAQTAPVVVENLGDWKPKLYWLSILAKLWLPFAASIFVVVGVGVDGDVDVAAVVVAVVAAAVALALDDA